MNTINAILFLSLTNKNASLFNRARTLGNDLSIALRSLCRRKENARFARFGRPAAGGVFLLISMLGCTEVPKAHYKVETVEQLLVELDYGFVNGLFDDEKFFEERIGYKLSGFPKDMEPESFSGPASGVGFEMSDGIFPGRKITVSKGMLRDGGKILRISFPVPPCLEKWRVPRFFPHDIIYIPSNFVYGVRSLNEPSLYGVRNYFGDKEQFVTFFVGGLDYCVSEIMVGSVYIKGDKK